MLTIKKNNLQLLCITVIGFLISYFISPFYYGGDQLHYTRAYDTVRGLDLLSANIAYISIIDSKEIIHFLIVWIGSNLGVSKLLLMSTANAFLYFLFLKLLLSMRVSCFVSFCVILTNYYLFTLFFTLEKLKFAIIFILIAILLMRKSKPYSRYVIASVLSHFQAAILLLSLFVASMARRSVGKTSKKYTWFLNLLLLVFVICVGFFFKEHLSSKFSYYVTASLRESVQNVVRVVFLMILSLLISKNRKQTCLLFAPLILAIAIVGGDRLNMIAYFFFLFYALQYRSGINYFTLWSSVYMFIKSVSFIYVSYLTGG